MKSVKVRNNSIDIFRYICAILVVAIHAEPFAEIDSNLSYFCVQILPRIAVPYFFTISGYYYIKKIIRLEDNINKVYWNYIKKLLAIYSIWSLIYIIINFFRELSPEMNASTFLKQVIIDYLISGSFYHLWFFPALFFAITVVTLLVKIKKIKLLAYISIILYLIGCLGCSYFEIGNHIPIIKELINFKYFGIIRRVILMGMPFFTMGYFINLFEKKINEIKNRTIIYYYLGILIIYILEIIIVNYCKLQSNIIITIFLYPLVFFTIILLLKHPMTDKEEYGRICNGIANFMYYVHPIFILMFQKILPVETNTIIFILTVAITSIIGFGIVKKDNKYLNRFIY